MDLKERLKNIKYDPLFKKSLEEKLSRGFQRRPRITRFISENINIILKEIYEPLGMWKQNPNESKEDFGVIIDNSWSPLNQADTNYTGHSMIFDRCNRYMLNLYRVKGIENITIDNHNFSYKNQIVFSEDDSDDDVINKLKIIFKIVRYKKNEIFLHTSEFAQELIKVYLKKFQMGDDAQHFYEKHIYEFFNDLISFSSTKGRGDYNDRKKGVDIWKKHREYDSTDQVKSVCNVYDKTDYFLIDVSLSARSNCDYFVFVCVGKRILVFRNDKTKIKFTNEGVHLPKELLHDQKFYNL